jgi:hypothetical protein
MLLIINLLKNCTLPCQIQILDIHGFPFPVLKLRYLVHVFAVCNLFVEEKFCTFHTKNILGNASFTNESHHLSLPDAGSDFYQFSKESIERISN